jgi:PhnB protein
MKINPYLTFDGRCEEAMNLYAKVLGGTIEATMRYEGTPVEAHVPAEWRRKVMHCCLKVGDMLLMASDAPPGQREPMKGMSVTLVMDDVAQAERVYAELSKGGTVGMPLQETFWAARFGMFTDRFGTPWMINCDRAA